MQKLDMELYDLETTQAEEWYNHLLGNGTPDEDAFTFEDMSLTESAFIRA